MADPTKLILDEIPTNQPPVEIETLVLETLVLETPEVKVNVVPLDC